MSGTAGDYHFSELKSANNEAADVTLQDKVKIDEMRKGIPGQRVPRAENSPLPLIQGYAEGLEGRDH